MRYFLEVAYKGTDYSGFQVQSNAHTIQSEVEKALQTVLKISVLLTGSSRTDAGVHAFQNFFHFDAEVEIDYKILYNLNAILPLSIVAKSIIKVSSDAHCRFQAQSRRYQYFITGVKNPFVTETAWYYPYSIDIDLLQNAANLLLQHSDFTSFSKRNTQVKTKLCNIQKSIWYNQNQLLVYEVEANRFLRGMVRGLVGTMLLVGRKKISIKDFEEIILSRDCTKASFATPPHGLFLTAVNYKV